MGLDETASDRQAKTGSARVCRLGEPVEDVRQQRWIDPRTGVPDDNLDGLAARCARCIHPDRATARRVAKRIRDEVREDLTDPDGIDVEKRDVVVDMGVEAEPG